jgi:hypothetical protein
MGEVQGAMRLAVMFNVVTLGALGVAALLLYPLASFLGAMAIGDPTVTAAKPPPSWSFSCWVQDWSRELHLGYSEIDTDPDSAISIAGVILIVIAIFHGPLLDVSLYLTSESRDATGDSRLELRSPMTVPSVLARGFGQIVRWGTSS